jgi:hypothetical protein
MHSVALTTAVATYERIVRHAARDATDLEVVLRRRLYAPPLRGMAVPACPMQRDQDALELLLRRVKRLPLALALLQDLRNDFARDRLFLLDFLQIDRTILGRGVHDAELGLVSGLRQLPLLVTLQVVVEGLLLHQLERLELEKLPEHVLFWLSLEQVSILGVRW